MRRSFLRLLLLAVLPSPLAAQEPVAPSAVCWRAQPKARCRVNIITNSGAYVGVGANGVKQRPDTRPTLVRALTDWGVLVNLTARDGAGVSYFVSYDSHDEFVTGAVMRYRRWIGRGHLDVALGTPVRDTDNDMLTSPFVMVKYSPSAVVGLALRPEIRRVREWQRWGETAWVTTTSRFVVSAGVEIGWAPGAIITGVVGLFGLYAASKAY